MPKRSSFGWKSWSAYSGPTLPFGRSIFELREAMECYISFPNDAVFGSMALPEESLTTQSEKTIPNSA